MSNVISTLTEFKNELFQVYVLKLSVVNDKRLKQPDWVIVVEHDVVTSAETSSVTLEKE
jgi:hypothetical protein